MTRYLVPVCLFTAASMLSPPWLSLVACLFLLAVLVLGGLLHSAGKSEREIERLRKP